VSSELSSSSKSESNPARQPALTRARWSVLQTGLITTGLALFAVYVMANRTNDLHLMTLYLPDWFPTGPTSVGILAASGYALGAWWYGVRVRRGLLATILALQLIAYVIAQYAEFQSVGASYRDSGQSLSFIDYFHRMTLLLASSAPNSMGDARAGYSMRAAEALLFVLSGMACALVLVGKPHCPRCRGLLQHRAVGNVSPAFADEILARLQELACSGDTSQFKKILESSRAREAELGNPAGTVELVMYRCAACHWGHLEIGRERDARQGDSMAQTYEVPAELFVHPPKPVGASGAIRVTSRPSARP
jgi:hypothetical protein